MTTWTACDICGRTCIVGAIHDCSGKYQQPIPQIAPATLMGWQCPVCGSVYAPHVQACWQSHTAPATGANRG